MHPFRELFLFSMSASVTILRSIGRVHQSQLPTSFHRFVGQELTKLIPTHIHKKAGQEASLFMFELGLKKEISL